MEQTGNIGKKYNIAVVGIGYVGLSNAVLFARRHEVTAIDIDQSRIEALSSGRSTVRDEEIEQYLKAGGLSLRATTDAAAAYSGADFVLVCVPTDYDEERQAFDTSKVEQVIYEAAAINPNAVIVIKSTVPIGFTQRMSEKLESNTLLFNPEFLREGHALYDNLHPSRIIIGYGEGKRECAELFAEMLSSAAEEREIPLMLTGLAEAEAIKLFSNTYLAARIAFFNELDMFSEENGLNTRQIIDGMGLDKRIGKLYNNPSFGYGGYCLPKDTRQLLSQFGALPQSVIGAAIESNRHRAEYIAGRIARLAREKSAEPCIGVYRITVKADSDNFRRSSTVELMNILAEKGLRLVVFEPLIKDKKEFCGFEVIDDFDAFCDISDLIVANRSSAELSGVMHKLYTRDIYCVD